MLVQKTESNVFLFWPCFAIPGTLGTPKTTAVVAVVLLFGEAVQPVVGEKSHHHLNCIIQAIKAI